MGQALYRKYRSTDLSEIVGQEHITQALQTALDSDRLSHAYLFTGPRGTGKTSIARILAQQINGLAYTSDPQLDIIEIDAASNRRIDEIRDLRDKVYIAPASLKYKVYIIDEVHMLTREAFNALLKTLEEPPAHAVFILATTDVHKLPDTIISRTQRYSFRPVEQSKVMAHLAYIAKQEGIAIEDDALQLLAEHGQGSFRDSISLLDQMGNEVGAISADMVRLQLGIPTFSALESVVASLQSHDATAPLKALAELYDQGLRASGIAAQLGQLLRQQLVENTTSIPAGQALSLLKQLLEVPSAHDPERFLELILMEAVVPANLLSNPPAAKPAPKTAPKTKAAEPAKPTAKAAAPPAEVTVVAEAPKSAPATSPKPSSDDVTTLDGTSWSEVLNTLKKQYNTIYGIVRMAQPDFTEAGKVTLGFGFVFHQKRISDPKNRQILADTIEQVTGQQIEVACIHTKVQPDAKPLAPATDALQDVSSVFGGGELV